ncbi:MAG: hypothetical protein JWM68_2525 [Verrucomicrobiales bacterium]|nr:hypothetical protein [Verrucomicrobiales bacterium]
MSAQDDIQIKLGLNATAFGPALRGVTGHLQKFKTDSGGIFQSWGKDLVAALTVGAIISQVKDLTSSVKQLRLEAKELDMSTGTIQTIQKQFKKMGEEPEKAIKGLEYFNIEIGKARKEGGAAAEAFRKYGISISNANGMTKSSEEVMGNLADVLHKVEDPATRAAIAVEFFGKKNAKMGLILEGGSKALGELRAKLEKRGAIISQENEDALLRVEATFKRIMEMKQGSTGNLLGNIIKRVEVASQYLGASTAIVHGEDGALRVIQQLAAEDKARGAVNRTVGEDLELQNSIAMVAKTIRDISYEEADEKGKLKILEKERFELFRKYQDASEEGGAKEKLFNDRLKIANEIRKLKLEIEKEHTAELDKQKQKMDELIAKQAELAKQGEKQWSTLKKATEERGKLTIKELLETRNPELAGDRAKAKKAEDLRLQGDKERLAGNVDKANTLYLEADGVRMGTGQDTSKLDAEIAAQSKYGNSSYLQNLKSKRAQMGAIDSIKSNERNPFESMTTQLTEIKEAMTKNGILIKPVNGK